MASPSDDLSGLFPLQCEHCDRKLHWKGNSFWECKKCRRIVLYHQSSVLESQIQALHDAFQRYPVLHLVHVSSLVSKKSDTSMTTTVYSMEPDTICLWWMNQERGVRAVQLTFFDDPQPVVIPLSPDIHWEWMNDDQDQREHFYIYLSDKTQSTEMTDPDVPRVDEPSKKRKDRDRNDMEREPCDQERLPRPCLTTVMTKSPDQWLIHQVDPKQATALIQWATRLLQKREE